MIKTHKLLAILLFTLSCSTHSQDGRSLTPRSQENLGVRINLDEGQSEVHDSTLPEAGPSEPKSGIDLPKVQNTDPETITGKGLTGTLIPGVPGTLVATNGNNGAATVHRTTVVVNNGRGTEFRIPAKSVWLEFPKSDKQLQGIADFLLAQNSNLKSFEQDDKRYLCDNVVDNNEGTEYFSSFLFSHLAHGKAFVRYSEDDSKCGEGDLPKGDYDYRGPVNGKEKELLPIYSCSALKGELSFKLAEVLEGPKDVRSTVTEKYETWNLDSLKVSSNSKDQPILRYEGDKTRLDVYPYSTLEGDMLGVLVKGGVRTELRCRISVWTGF